MRPPMYSELCVVLVVVVVVVDRAVGRVFFLLEVFLNDDLTSLLLSLFKRFRLVLLVPCRLRDLDGFRGRLGAAISLAPTLQIN